jgi:RHS repeat-associated protein
MVVQESGGGCGTARTGVAGYCQEGPRMMFTGQQRDGETGLDYFNARYLGTALGRFGSPDEPLIAQKVVDPQSWNLYSYVLNNPLVFTDPSGREPCKDGINPENGNICTVVTGMIPGDLVGGKPDTKLDSPVFLALAQGINNSRSAVETAAVATGVVVSLPVLVPGTIVLIDGVAYTWEGLIALGPKVLAQLVAAGKLTQELWAKIQPYLGGGLEISFGKGKLVERINLLGDWRQIPERVFRWSERLPHYHRRFPGDGGGINRHRPWDAPGVDRTGNPLSWWKRF